MAQDHGKTVSVAGPTQGGAKPLKMLENGVETEINGLGMRALAAPDLHLLDQFRGQPIALARNIVAALCDIPVDHVAELDLKDFTVLASDALWQVQQVSIAMGLPDDFFRELAGAGADA